MLAYSILNYLALSLMFVLVLIDAGRLYLLGATLVLVALIFVGPARLTVAQMKSDVPKSSYWWLILFVGMLVFSPFYRVATGVDLLKVPDSSVKLVVTAVWAAVTIIFVRGIYFSCVRDKA